MNAPIDQRALSKATFAYWLSHLFSVEADAACDGRRHHRDMEPGDNGTHEYLRLERLAEAWRVRKLMALDIDANSQEETWIDGVALRRWTPDS